MSEAGRIQFDKDAITPINGGDGAATAAGGVYPMRQRSIAPRSLASKRSQKSLDLEKYDSDWTEGYDERDIKTKQVCASAAGYLQVSYTLRPCKTDTHIGVYRLAVDLVRNKIQNSMRVSNCL